MFSKFTKASTALTSQSSKEHSTKDTYTSCRTTVVQKTVRFDSSPLLSYTLFK